MSIKYSTCRGIYSNMRFHLRNQMVVDSRQEASFWKKHIGKEHFLSGCSLCMHWHKYAAIHIRTSEFVFAYLCQPLKKTRRRKRWDEVNHKLMYVFKHAYIIERYQMKRYSWIKVYIYINVFSCSYLSWRFNCRDD